jgi:DNA-binding response OmpR family regulator
MHPSFLRILLTAASPQEAAVLEHFLTDEGHEVVVVESRGDAALKAARLIHPDLVILSGPLRGPLDGIALAAALQNDSAPTIPVMLVTEPTELPGLLALHVRSENNDAPEARRLDTALDAALEEADS